MPIFAPPAPAFGRGTPLINAGGKGVFQTVNNNLSFNI